MDISLLMNFYDWLGNKLSSSEMTPMELKALELKKSVAYKNFAVNACINLIASTISIAEFRTYKDGEEIRGENYYTLNVEPNQNKNASTFWREVLEKLVFEDEALLVQVNSRWYLAQSFVRKEYSLNDNIYEQIEIGKDRSFVLRETFKENQVVYLHWHNHKMRTEIDSIYEDYQELIAASHKSYKKSSDTKSLVTYDAEFSKTTDRQKELKTITEEYFRDFMTPGKDSYMPLTKGLDYREVGNVRADSASNISRESRNYIDDVIDLICISFGVPPALLKGDVADLNNVINRYLMFCIKPLANMLNDEINRKWYGRDSYLKNTYVNLDITNIKTTDIKDLAASMDVMLRTGAFTIDDILRTLGKVPLNDDIGNQRFMTKNYAPIEDVIKGVESQGKEVDLNNEQTT